MSGCDIVRVRSGTLEAPAARDLLTRFFSEEGFDTPFNRIAESLQAMLGDEHCWVALARTGGEAAAIITVTTMLYIEWGRLGEIADLYVVPDRRGQGIAAQLLEAAADWCRGRGCSAVSVVVAPEGEKRHGLTKFYQRHSFKSSGRTIMTQML